MEVSRKPRAPREAAPTGPFGGGARQLLRAVRDIMATSVEPGERLDRLVRTIADSFVAEVCSIYVMRDGARLELMATVGLRAEAVGQTRLRVGEGLIGTIAERAEPLTLPDAQSHPRFAYRPETGEEVFRSLMGVPVLQAGRVVGVVAVQNVTARDYDDQDVESLETIAMALGELLVRGELRVAELPDAALPVRIAGTPLAPGLAMGRVVLHRPDIAIKRIVADDPAEELRRLRRALGELHAAIDEMMAGLEAPPGSAGESSGGETRDILETYRMFAHDRGWLVRLSEAIRSGLTAEAAVVRVRDDTRARMESITDPYLRERLIDLDDLHNRLMQHLMGADTGTAEPPPLPEDAVLVARTLGPAELLDYEPERLRAVVLEEGSHTAHVAIVAKALQIPVIGRAARVMREARIGDTVIVDGDHGHVLLRPAEQARETFAHSMRLRDAERRAYLELRDLPAVTRDGVAVTLNVNAGLLIDLAQLHQSGAEGVGLYRTEIPFMVRPGFPTVRAQTDLYARILAQAEDKPVTFRTLDAGGDKLLPYFPVLGEENPAMGWRAIRIGLDLPAMLRQQLRALVRAAAGRPLSVMFPMVSEVAEFTTAREMLDLELARAAAQGAALPSDVAVGVMLEVPALVWQLPALLPRVDFLSVGSNDLLQFLFAADRGSPSLAGRYDPLSPPVLNLLASVVERCREAGVPLALCGEMAGHPLEAMTLIGLGFRALSMPPAALGPVKRMTRSVESGPLAAYIQRLLLQADHSLRPKLRAFARDHGVLL